MQQPSQNRRFLIGFGAIMLALAGFALWQGRWQIGFVALATLGLSLVPVILANRLEITLPVPFLVATGAFVFASVFLGEVFDFYEKVWWWDLALHGSSAVGFGLIGFLFVFMMFEGDLYAAPPIALGFIATCLAVSTGTLWEIFEYTMDTIFGTNMLKSGVDDIVTDMIVNVIGAAVGGFSGTLYLKRVRWLPLSQLIAQFVALNRRFYQRSRDRIRRR